MKLEEFISYLEGNFNNKEQFLKMQKNNIKYPFCEHTNIVCNNKRKVLKLGSDNNEKNKN